MLARQTSWTVSDKIVHASRHGHRMMTTLRVSRHRHRLMRYQVMTAAPLRVAIRV